MSVFDDVLTAIGPVVDLGRVQTTGRVAELVIGNGFVISQYIANLIVQAQEEILFSTCFWAASPSLSCLHDSLVTLNNRARNAKRRVTVKIMLSSYSFAQKFLTIKGVRIWKP